MLAALYTDHLRTLRNRTDDALARCGFESLAIYAGRPHMFFLDDHGYTFKTNPHFALWTPLADPQECWIVYRPERRLQLVFLQPADYWHKPPEMPSGFWTEHFDIEVIRTAEEAKQYVANLPRSAFIGEWREEFEQWGFADRNPPQLLNRLHYPRAIKTEYEIECMRRASRIAASGHRAAEDAFRAGASEFEIHQAYLRGSEQNERDLPYTNIIALNEHAAVLHYQYLDRTPPSARRSFLIDAGAQVHSYACDITRTYSYADDEYASLIEGMHRLQQKLCAQVRNGTDYAAIHLDTHRLIGDLLHDAGIISAKGEAATELGVTSVFFPHGIGHLLGIQVHDVGGFMIDAEGRQKERPAGHPYLRLTRTLEPGFVVTIEPGIYFIDMLLATARESAHARAINWNQVERFKRCGGIRIEDDVVCTAGEPENLTRDAFESTLSVTGVAALA